MQRCLHRGFPEAISTESGLYSSEKFPKKFEASTTIDEEWPRCEKMLHTCTFCLNIGDEEEAEYFPFDQYSFASPSSSLNFGSTPFAAFLKRLVSIDAFFFRSCSFLLNTN